MQKIWCAREIGRQFPKILCKMLLCRIWRKISGSEPGLPSNCAVTDTAMMKFR